MAGAAAHPIQRQWIRGSTPAGPRHLAPTRAAQRTVDFSHSPSAWGALDHVSTSVAMALSKCSIKKKKSSPCSPPAFKSPQKLQIKRLQSELCLITQSFDKWHVMYEEKTEVLLSLVFVLHGLSWGEQKNWWNWITKRQKCWGVKEINARV